ncbi:MAG: hypothetical protein CL776_03950 [Chloroflexi bacterium]|nr:hypothetical protein [Chloroflexota bacterium]|tara:strand:- start:415 stop:1191 length:777 start_codon:yes stop_codon:yes gene_type:complete
MTLEFEIGDPSRPRGHALLYFKDSDSSDIYTTYLIVLPVEVDMGKYLPPLLATQLGGMMGGLGTEGMGSIAAPPMPELMTGGFSALERLAIQRSDDLVFGGNLSVEDIQSSVQVTSNLTQEYAQLYSQGIENTPAMAVAEANKAEDANQSSDVHRVLFELLSERDRLAELSKLVGTIRFAVEQENTALVNESDNAMLALEGLLPDHYWVGRIRLASRDTSQNGEKIMRLLVERCYLLLNEDFSALEELENQIKLFSED